MPITITVTGDTVQEVRSDIARLLGADLSSEQAKPAAESKAGKSTAASAKTATAPKAEEQAASSETAASPSEEKAASAAGEDKVALLKSLAMKFAQKNGREALVALFAEFGASNPSTVPADRTDAVIARLQE